MEHRNVPTRRGQAAFWGRVESLGPNGASQSGTWAAGPARRAPQCGGEGMGERLIRHPLIAVAIALLTLTVAGAAYAACGSCVPPPTCNCQPPSPPPPPSPPCCHQINFPG